MNAVLQPKWNFSSLLGFYDVLSPTQSLPVFFVFVIYLSMLLDNILRSIIVPLLPDLLTLEEERRSNTAKTEISAILLASKTIIQLAANSFVAVFVQRVGCQSALLAGNIVLLITSLSFALGDTFYILLMARGLQGIASTIITVSGMSICAEKFTNDEKVRSKFMGFMIGSDAAGVLCAYTVGILAFNVCGKLILFLIIAFIIVTNASLLFVHIRKNEVINESTLTNSTTRSSYQWYHLMGNSTVLLISAALFSSSSTIAILEPCLPIWIKENITLEKWQSGLIFLPDSLGYLISTSVTPTISYRIGKWRTVALAALVIGLCAISIPSSRTLFQLSMPHFCIGFGIGAVDSTVIPMLADFADFQRNTHYSSMYALEQGVTSLAYVCGYLFTAEVIKIIGFPALILAIGIINIIYGVVVCAGEFTFLKRTRTIWRKSDDFHTEIELISTKHFSYNALENACDSD